MRDNSLDLPASMGSDTPAVSSQAELSSQHGPTGVADDDNYIQQCPISKQTRQGAWEGEGLEKETTDEDEDLSDDCSDDGDEDLSGNNSDDEDKDEDLNNDCKDDEDCAVAQVPMAINASGHVVSTGFLKDSGIMGACIWLMHPVHTLLL